MTQTTNLPTPKQRLAMSRSALLAAMGYTAIDTATGTATDAATDARTEMDTEGRRALPLGAAGGTAPRVRRGMIGRWWRRSHLSTAAEIGAPFLQDYAERHPAKLMAYAAGVGSLIVLVKPWRLLSLGMVVGLLWRSTDLTGFMSDYLRAESDESETLPPLG